jgi:hypothetical protein
MALTAEQSKDITDLLSCVELGEGLGGPSMPCSIAAINIALSGELTDEIPDCMSLVIGKWVIAVQDLMPHGTRNCRQWKELLPLAAGTGRDREKEEARFNLLADWMWERVLPRISTDEWPADTREAWGKTLRGMKELSPECVETLMYLEGANIDVNLKSLKKVALVQWSLGMAPLLFPLTLNAIANAATYTTYCVDADWEDGVWDDSDGLDVIGMLERLIEV